jgi:ribonuclease HI
MKDEYMIRTEEFINRENKEVEGIKNTILRIYCDGACRGNPGKSGSGLAIYYPNTPNPTLLYGQYQEYGTNNMAELKALYKALQIASKYKEALIYSDSKYSIDCVINWAYGWKKNGWSKRGGEIKNLEIIKLTHNLYDKLKNVVTIKYVKGHSGIEGNELADRMANLAIKEKILNYKECC